MLFQRKIDRAFKKLHDESDHPEIDHFAKERKMGKMKSEEPGNLFHQKNMRCRNWKKMIFWRWCWPLF